MFRPISPCHDSLRQATKMDAWRLSLLMLVATVVVSISLSSTSLGGFGSEEYAIAVVSNEYVKWVLVSIMVSIPLFGELTLEIKKLFSAPDERRIWLSNLLAYLALAAPSVVIYGFLSTNSAIVEGSTFAQHQFHIMVCQVALLFGSLQLLLLSSRGAVPESVAHDKNPTSFSTMWHGIERVGMLSIALVLLAVTTLLLSVAPSLANLKVGLRYASFASGMSGLLLSVYSSVLVLSIHLPSVLKTWTFSSHHQLFGCGLAVVLTLLACATIAISVAAGWLDGHPHGMTQLLVAEAIVQSAITTSLVLLNSQRRKKQSSSRRDMLQRRLDLIRYVSHEMRSPLNTAFMGLNILSCTLDRLQAEDSAMVLKCNTPVPRNSSRRNDEEEFSACSTIVEGFLRGDSQVRRDSLPMLLPRSSDSTQQADDQRRGSKSAGVPTTLSNSFSTTASVSFRQSQRRGSNVSSRSTSAGASGPAFPGSLSDCGVFVSQEDVTEISETVGQVAEACKIALSTLEDLLTFDKLDANKLDLERAEVPAWQFMESSAVPFRINAREAEVDLQLQLRIREQDRSLIGIGAQEGDTAMRVAALETLLKQIVVVDVDTFKFGQVLRNLLSNAVKFTPAEGTVSVSMEPSFSLSPLLQGGYDPESQRWAFPTGVAPAEPVFVRLAVTDTGAGISAEDQAKLFQQYQQFNASKLQKGGGSGLGLWISKRIVELHGGRIGCESRGEGCGSSFFIDLPCRLQLSSDQSPRKMSTSDDSGSVRDLSMRVLIPADRGLDEDTQMSGSPTNKQLRKGSPCRPLGKANNSPSPSRTLPMTSALQPDPDEELSLDLRAARSKQSDSNSSTARDQPVRDATLRAESAEEEDLLSQLPSSFPTPGSNASASRAPPSRTSSSFQWPSASLSLSSSLSSISSFFQPNIVNTNSSSNHNLSQHAQRRSSKSLHSSGSSSGSRHASAVSSMSWSWHSATNASTSSMQLQTQTQTQGVAQQGDDDEEEEVQQLWRCDKNEGEDAAAEPSCDASAVTAAQREEPAALLSPASSSASTAPPPVTPSLIFAAALEGYVLPKQLSPQQRLTLQTLTHSDAPSITSSDNAGVRSRATIQRRVASLHALSQLDHIAEEDHAEEDEGESALRPRRSPGKLPSPQHPPPRLLCPEPAQQLDSTATDAELASSPAAAVQILGEEEEENKENSARRSPAALLSAASSCSLLSNNSSLDSAELARLGKKYPVEDKNTSSSPHRGVLAQPRSGHSSSSSSSSSGSRRGASRSMSRSQSLQSLQSQSLGSQGPTVPATPVSPQRVVVPQLFVDVEAALGASFSHSRSFDVSEILLQSQSQTQIQTQTAQSQLLSAEDSADLAALVSELDQAPDDELFSEPPSVDSAKLTSSAVAQGGVQTAAAHWDEGLHVLVCDDSAPNRRILCRLLTNMGHVCVEAVDGVHCLELYARLAEQRERIDLVLLDEHMPRMNGPEAAQRLRELGHRNAVFAVTGEDSAEAHRRFLSCGADAVFVKPLNVARLRERYDSFEAAQALQRGSLLLNSPITSE